MTHINPGRHMVPFGSLHKIDSLKVWHKVGNNPAVNTTEEDIWLVGGTETLLTAGSSMWIACDDNSNGVGQTIRVEGLDANWEYVSADVVLAGNTPVLIGEAGNWTRIHLAYQVSAEPDPVGDVWIGDDDTDFVAGVPATASTVHGFIDYTNAAQQTQKCMFTVPAGYKALIYDFNAQIGTPSGAARTVDAFIEVQELALGATVANPSWAPWRRIEHHAMISDAQSAATDEYVFPLGPFGELTNIHVRATASASSIVLADMTIVTYEE